MPTDTTTEKDVALDILAALDMFAGSVGDDGVVIDEVTESADAKATLNLTLSNGDRYEIRVRART
jgi:hypothetical protein